jgi:hypothetical protein
MSKVRLAVSAASLCAIVTSAHAGLVSFSFVVDTSSLLEAQFVFGPVSNTTYSVGPITSPNGFWQVAIPTIIETKDSPDSVSLSGSITAMNTGTSGPFSFTFDALSVQPIPAIFETSGNESFSAAIAFAADGNQMLGYGLGVGAGIVPEPSTWAMILLGFAGLGWAGYRASRRTAAAAA